VASAEPGCHVRRPFRYLVWSSRWYVAAVVVIAAFGYAFACRLTRWRGNWWWGYDNVIQAVPIAVLGTAFVVGWDAGARNSGPQAWLARLPDASSKVPLSLLLLPLGSVLLTLAGFTAAVVGVTLAFDGVVDGRAPLVIISHGLMLCFAASLGLFAGRLQPAAYAALTALAVVALLLFWSPAGGRHVFGFPGASSGMVGIRPSIGYYAANIATLAVATLALSVGAGVRVLNWSRLLATGFVVAGALVVGSAVGSTKFYVTSSDRADRCAGSDLRVCLYPGYDPLLPATITGLEDFFDKAQRRGGDPAAFPHEYHHDGGPRPPVGVGALHLGDFALETREWDPTSLAISVSTPLWCASLFSPVPPDGLLEERQIVFDWAQWTEGELTAGEFFFRHEKLRGLSEAALAERVERSLARMRDCADS
jgi:hypothetical protein